MYIRKLQYSPTHTVVWGTPKRSFPLNIARALSDEGEKILGTSIDSINIAEDRDLFRKMMDQLGIPMPESDMATNIDETLACVKQIGGYPVMIHPSFVLGGRGWPERNRYAARDGAVPVLERAPLAVRLETTS